MQASLWACSIDIQRLRDTPHAVYPRHFALNDSLKHLGLGGNTEVGDDVQQRAVKATDEVLANADAGSGGGKGGDVVENSQEVPER